MKSDEKASNSFLQIMIIKVSEMVCCIKYSKLISTCIIFSCLITNFISIEWDFDLAQCVCDGAMCLYGIIDNEEIYGQWSSCNNGQDCCCLLLPR